MGKLGKNVHFRKISIIESNNGDLIKGFLKSEMNDFDVKEVYFSEVKNNFIKGWIKHNVQTCNFIVPIGKIKLVIFEDDFDNDPIIMELSKSNHQIITVPPGNWFAFKGIENNNLLVNITDLEHDDSESDSIDIDKIEFSWD
ncbi:MAG: dTDP-4-dehydrorhamnose 3,5-epimerase [Chloroflexi bacterium]|nr:dTDP-4-dehydrorhamnose 3,5-epimerase [Chloroflexota bacterium]